MVITKKDECENILLSRFKFISHTISQVFKNISVKFRIHKNDEQNQTFLGTSSIIVDCSQTHYYTHNISHAEKREASRQHPLLSTPMLRKPPVGVKQ